MIYTQNWTAGIISESGYYESTADGLGPNAPIAGYPDLIAGEGFHVVAGAGPTGQHVLDQNTATESGSAGVCLVPDPRDVTIVSGNSSSAGGHLNGAQGRVTWQQFFSSTYWTVNGGYAAILFLGDTVYGGTFGLEDYDGHLALKYREFDGAGGTTVSEPDTYGLTLDDAWHALSFEWQCAVPNGGYTDADTSGSLRVQIDRVDVYHLTGLKLMLSQAGWVERNQLVGLAFGFYGLLGPLTDIVYTDTLTPAFLPAWAGNCNHTLGAMLEPL